MWFKLATADFKDKNLGKMADIAGSWGITYTLQGNISKDNCPTTVKMNDGKTQAAADFTATFTLGEGATLTSITAKLKSSGTQLIQVTSGTSITIPAASITGDIEIIAIATGSSTGGGSEGGEPDTPVTPSPDTPTEPADVLQLNAFRYDEDVTINSGGDTSTKSGYNTFYEIPVLPSSVYYIPGAVRVVLLNSSKAYRNDYNIYTDSGSNVGQASYVATDANTAFLNITILESKCTIADAKIQIAHITTTVKDTKTLASTGATLVTGKKLASSSYTESTDDNYIVYKDIPVTAGSTYKITGSARVWFLAEDKTTTKGSSVNPTTGGVPEKFCFKIPTGAAYASASIYKNNMDKSAEELELHELTVAYSV